MVYNLKPKTKVLEAFQDYEAFVENQTGERIKGIRMDNDKEEYVNRNYFHKKGIQHETSAPYNPKQNGLAKRINRTSVERARSVLAHTRIHP